MVLVGRHRKLHYRNLLYTAVTRAKKRLIIVGETDTVSEMILNAHKSLRYTSLSYLLQEDANDEVSGYLN
jgi:exodeoxyribonuclease V alpha subunit